MSIPLRWIGPNKLAVLNFAVLAVAIIAIVGAISSYVENYLTTSVGQSVMHDLRRTLYHHIHRLSLAEHDEKRTGDLIGRVTTDIEAIQTFITTALLGILSSVLTLVGIIGIMLYLNWRFTLISLAIAPVLFVVVYVFTRRESARSGRLNRLVTRAAEIAAAAPKSLTKLFALFGRHALPALKHLPP